VSDASDDFVTMVLAHEAAHLWFGCLVEGRWWDDLWLAEATATYLSYGAMSEVLGVDSAWAEFAMQEQAAAYQADGLPSTEPISSEVETAGEALSHYLLKRCGSHPPAGRSHRRGSHPGRSSRLPRPVRRRQRHAR
jgi:hypothetical protein